MYEQKPEVFLPRRAACKARHQNGNGFGLTLGMAIHQEGPTTGKLNPRWVETLMGFPVGWAKPDGPPLRGTHNTPGSHPEPAEATPDGSQS